MNLNGCCIKLELELIWKFVEADTELIASAQVKRIKPAYWVIIIIIIIGSCLFNLQNYFNYLRIQKNSKALTHLLKCCFMHRTLRLNNERRRTLTLTTIDSSNSTLSRLFAVIRLGLANITVNNVASGANAA